MALIRKVDGGFDRIPRGTLALVPDEFGVPVGWVAAEDARLDEALTLEPVLTPVDPTPIDDATDAVSAAFAGRVQMREEIVNAAVVEHVGSDRIEIPIRRSRRTASTPRIANLPPSLRSPRQALDYVRARGVTVALAADNRTLVASPASLLSSPLRVALVRHAVLIRALLFDEAAAAVDLPPVVAPVAGAPRRIVRVRAHGGTR